MGKNYPYLGQQEFSNFCDTCEITDKKYLNISTIDRVFLTVDVDFDKTLGNQAKMMNRYEFFEALVRLAHIKYREFKEH